MIGVGRIEGYVKEVLGRNSSQVPESLHVEKLKGGENHHLFKVTYDSKETPAATALVVRIKIDTSSAYERAKSEREARVLAFLKGANSAPIVEF